MNIIEFILALFISFIIFFMRSPNRLNYKYEHDFIYSPCNGRILHIKDIDDKTTRIVYYLNVFDNHTQYVPIDSKVIYTKRYAGIGSYYRAYEADSDKNSNMETILKSTKYNFIYKITQRTGIIARRIINYSEQSEENTSESSYQVGEKLGFIMFGSRVDIDIPKNVISKILVKEGDHIKKITKIIKLK